MFRKVIMIGVVVLLANSLFGAEVQTRMLSRCGMGFMSCAIYSPNPERPYIATGGAIGAVVWNIEPAETTAAINSGLIPSTTYFYLIDEIDGSGNRGQLTAPLSATTLSATDRIPDFDGNGQADAADLASIIFLNLKFL